MLEADTIIVKDSQTLEKLFSYAERTNSEIVSYDLETDSPICITANLYGIGVCFDTNRAFYIPWRAQPLQDESQGDFVWGESTRTRISNWVLHLAETKKMIGHNIIFDVLVTKYQLNVDITKKFYSDTILLKHTIDEEPPHGLKECAVRDLGPWADKAQEELKDEVIANGGKWTMKQKDMYRASTQILGKYCCWDVLLTMLLFRKYSIRLEKEGLEKLFYEDEIIPLYKWCTIPMKDKGFPIDVDYYENLKKEIEIDIIAIEKEATEQITMDCDHIIEELLDKEVPLKNSGVFPKYLAEQVGVVLPVNEKGVVTLAAKAIELQKEATPIHTNFYDWVLGDKTFTESPVELVRALTFDAQDIRKAREKYYCIKKKRNFVFNIGSSDQLISYFLKHKGYKATETTDKGKPKVDAEFLKGIAHLDESAGKILDYKRLCKLHSTYIVGILDRQINSRIHTDMVQFGTTSGRYASRNPNLNNLPSVKEGGQLSDVVLKYTNSIRQGLIVNDGYSMIGCDWSSLEPHLAAYVSRDKGLIDIFVTGKDFYSAIGIKQFGITDATPYKDGSPDSFAEKYKSLRSLVKTYALAAFYGATAPRIAQVTGKTKEESKKLLNSYFRAFPEIHKFIKVSHFSALKKGLVKTELGRIRHLQQAQDIDMLYDSKKMLNYRWAKANNHLLTRSKLRNLLNNAVNFQIQGFAAHCLNRALIKMTKEFDRKNLEARVMLCIHDEVLVEAKTEQVEEVAQVVKWAMETCVDVSPIKLKAEPVIGKNYAECK